jgi:hemolysin D
MTAGTPRHPLPELLARYRAVLGAAWQMRREIAGPRRLADEAAFLPAALALQETPVHPAPRRAAWVIIALFMLALGWACLGKVDIVTVAPGRIVVSDGTKVVQPLETSVVKAIHVRDGSLVQAGQVLIELDPTAAAADGEALRAQLQAARDEEARAAALQYALRTGAAPPAGDARQRAEWADMAAKLARLDAELARRGAEWVTAREAAAKLRSTLPLAQRREAELNALATQGFVSAHAGQDRTRERIEMESDLATLRARITEAEAAQAESRQARAAYLAETERALNERHARARLELQQLKPQEAKSRHREGLTLLKAPIAGRVQQLAVHTTGGVVTEAQVLLIVVPDEAEVTAEVVVENKDIGFVREGQPAEVKLETFAFTRYGTVPAEVVRVSRDAVPDEKRGAVFAATLKLARAAIDVDGKAVRLGPGMGVTAEIRTGERRVIAYLTSPLQRAVAESGRER